MKLLISLFFFAIAILFIHLSIQTVEKRECQEWQSTSRIFAEWQIEQCTNYQIKLN